MASRRKTLLLASGILAAGGAAAYMQSRFRVNKNDSLDQCNGKEVTKDKVVKNASSSKNKQKKGGFKALKVLTAILLSEIGISGATNLLALVGTVVLRTALSNRIAQVQGFLFRAAFLRRVPLFFQLISENIILSFLLSTIQSTLKFLTGTMGLNYRKILTKRIHSDYFKNMTYYKISHVDGRITNPEQRIASDVPRFCSELSEIVQDDLVAVTDTLLYTWRLCSYASPKYAIWLLVYALGSTTASKIFSPTFGKLMSKEQQLEGEYRQLHSRLRTNSESIAYYGGEKREEYFIQQKFKALVRHMKVVLHDYWWFGTIEDFLLKYLGAAVSVILIAEPFFTGHLNPDSSTLERAEMLSNLRYHTSVIFSLFQSLGTLSISTRRLNRLSGYAHRIYELMAGLCTLIQVVTPNGNVLVDRLNLKIEAGSNLLITGPNGSGKSSLFRVLGGLWPLMSGYIAKPGSGSDLNKEIFYVPQRPYTAVGTLRDQLIYPLTSVQEVEPLTDSRMMELLKNVDLEHLLDRYSPEKEVNWGDELSLGEQQRLGMARLFYHKPKFAILDECTSAVTTIMEERFYTEVRAMGTSCITISHRPALVAFHDMVLALDGEGGWVVHDRREDSSIEMKIPTVKASETKRHSEAKAVQQAFFMNKKDSAPSNSKAQSYISEVIASSPSMNSSISPSVLPQLRGNTRILPLRAASTCKVLIPTVFDKQGLQMLAVAFLVVSKTWASDRIAKLNGRLALGWRIRMTEHLLKNYLRNNTFYKVFNMSIKNIDADQRLTHDLEKFTTDLSLLVPGLVKPTVDILWFTWRMKLLTGQRGVAILYTYMLLGLGFLRIVTPDFGDLINQELALEGTFRFMHERLRTHAESVAFFGGGAREKAMVESRFIELLNHSKYLLKKKWVFGILDDFITRQLPNNVTWLLSLLYAVEQREDAASMSGQGDLANSLRFLASVVSQSFLAFGDILKLDRKFVELSGGINRLSELEEILDAAQSGSFTSNGAILPVKDSGSKDAISFSKVDIVTPNQKILARELTCDIELGESMLITGPNGSGKSSVSRVLRGLWPVASGRLFRPSEDVNHCGIFYVPQRPYTCLGTLRDQIIYPLSRDEAELKASKMYGKGILGTLHPDTGNYLDTRLQIVLENVQLIYLLERDERGWDASPNWGDILSLGEQQRLAMRPALIPFHSSELRLIDGEGKNNKIQLNTKKVSSKSITPFWNESFNLECSCPQEFLETLEQESMVLELRQRKKGIWGSHLIGKGLIPWKKILDSSNMMLKEWVKMDLVDGSDDIHKAPEVEVEIKIRVRSMENEENNLNKWDKCVCKNGHDIHPWLSAEDYDIFTLGAALEAF
ncbi:unnamed protein product [Lupinus luteus]|uniref:ABC transporter D family member 1 n=1 Tax=Lupinus luteus TaxID=3873 RepID=A0AAV1XH96_LUPLU